MQNLKALVFTVEAQVAANGVIEFDMPVGMTILGVSLCAEAFANTPTTFTIDIQDDGTDTSIAALAASTAGTPGTWYTPALGGTETPITVAAGSDVEIDLNLDSDTADFTAILYVTWDEV